MMRISNGFTKTALAILILGVAVNVPEAQERRSWGMDNMPGWGMGRMMQGWGSGPMMGYGSDFMLDRIDGRLAFMKTELKITDAQAAAWDDFAAAVRETAEAHNTLMQAMMNQMGDGEYFDMSLPERLGLQQDHIEARLDQVKQLKVSTEKLYAVLDEEQKKTADDIVLPTMGMGMMGGGFGGRGMMMRP
jgi:hypothetical protein